MSADHKTSGPGSVLRFWFEEIDSRSWWVKDAELDDRIRDRFGGLLERAARAELLDWRSSPRGRLAEIIVLDQFSRNIHRGTARAFAQDAMALVLAQEAVSLGIHSALEETQRMFLLMPYMHSESRAIHVLAEALFSEFTAPSSYQFELKHKAIIDRFGRYPHRNENLGRTSTVEERAFLEQPGSGF